MKIVFSSVFEDDFAEVVGYFASEVTPELSIRFENQVVETYKLISANPQIGRLRKDLSQPEIRSLVVGGFENYILFYQIRKNDVFFVRLLHGARNLPELL
ncbi:MAG TPA: type II toxin-antitoxin system RelE/ParE family toxin [Verrucomicrobiae bacterium]|nr:type II toxin-antitoxin system RelE/ParE family toxin [Verrucomicrobiae bacterium]